MAAIDRMSRFDDAVLSTPATDGESVTPSDLGELSSVTRALYVGGAGNVSLVTAGGTLLVFVGVSAGTLLPIRAKQVLSTGTTATAILGLW